LLNDFQDPAFDIAYTNFDDSNEQGAIDVASWYDSQLDNCSEHGVGPVW